MTDEARFDAMQAAVAAWPATPPPSLGDDARRFYLAGKDALRSEHILSVQRHRYCAHPMSFVLRPIFDTTFEMVTLKVREASFDA